MTLRLQREPFPDGPAIILPEAVCYELVVSAPDEFAEIKFSGALIREDLMAWLHHYAADGNVFKHTNVSAGTCKLTLWVLGRFTDRFERDFTLLQIAGPEALKTLF